MNKDGKILLAVMVAGFALLGSAVFAVNQKAERPVVIKEMVTAAPSPSLTATPSATVVPSKSFLRSTSPVVTLPVKTQVVTPVKK
jgi:hypothetical protein